jgi:hypothetical protein
MGTASRSLVNLCCQVLFGCGCCKSFSFCDYPAVLIFKLNVVARFNFVRIGCYAVGAILPDAIRQEK